MKPRDFTTRFVTDATPQEVFDGINNVRGWWSENIEGSTDQLNSVFVYRDKYLTAKMRITHCTPQKIVWDVIETHNEFFKHKTEWDGTKIVFEIADKAGSTEVKFTHVGLVPEFECFTVCSSSWDFFIKDSLKKLIETGKGNDISGDEHSYTTSILVNKSPGEVFKAINDIKNWWSENIEGNTNKTGAELFYHYNDVHLMKLKIVELRPYDKIVWFVKDFFFNFTQDKAELAGTKIVFDIIRKGDQTQLLFTHHGLVQECECYTVCKTSWDELIGESLYQLITTGKGNPISKQYEGFDAGFVEAWRSGR